jgi:DNA-binding winged helix-turn-helix (wHTH) protein
MPRHVNITNDFILNYAVELLKKIGSQEELPERGSELLEALIMRYYFIRLISANAR